MAPVTATEAVVAAAISIAVASYCFICKSNNITRLPLSFNENKKQKLKRNGLVGAIGNTPLIRINSLSEATGCEILGKCEFLNPGGNVKDRVAVKIVEEALESGKLTQLKVE